MLNILDECMQHQLPDGDARQRVCFLSSFLLLNGDLDMNLGRTKDMELAQNMELGEENGSRRDTLITIDDSQENCKIRQNLENVIRKHSDLARVLSTLIKNL
ncbi:hypothetical protein NPIL_291701 [Nephila pilipes]|uniref:Uncharacterized protein n=1 Tax=Nephila pilipes TaxID=299642 RepID=A0A8X6UPB4_NEPPI|nr:hypothetical protein NPIL_291701 [Nephila pilipes]